MQIIKVHSPTYYEILDVDGDRDSLEEQLGGRYRPLNWFGKGKVALCNEQQTLLKQGEFNRQVGGTPVYGPFLVLNENHGSYFGLTQDEALDTMYRLSGV